MVERWVQINTIEGYENIKDWYWLSSSDKDKVINRSTGKQLKLRIDNHGYKRIDMKTKDGKHKTCNIHILKSKAFIYGPNILGANIVRHLNDIKTDNRLENLAWGTRSQNVRDSIRNGKFNYESCAINGKINGKKNGKINGKIYGKIGGKISGKINGATIGKKLSKPVRCIETGEIFSSTREASRQLGICQGSISYNCRGKQNTAGGLHFEFVDQKENEN